MANWSLPTLSSLYSDVISLFKDRDLDLAKGLDPAKVTVTNPSTDMICWSSANNKWQRYNGTSWVDLTATYGISISGNAATATTATTATNATQLGGVAAASYARLDAVPTFAGGATGAEGGEIRLLKPPSGSTLGGNLVFDIVGDMVRIFENGGSYRGANFVINTCAAGVGSQLWHSNNDGAGSGLDADLLDGQQGAYYQQALVSGTNIRTLNGQSLLGSGNVRHLPLMGHFHCHGGRTDTLAVNSAYDIYISSGTFNLVLPNKADTLIGDRIELYNVHMTVGVNGTTYIKMPAVGAASINGVTGDMLIDRAVGALVLVCAWNDTSADWIIV